MPTEHAQGRGHPSQPQAQSWAGAEGVGEPPGAGGARSPLPGGVDLSS